MPSHRNPPCPSRLALLAGTVLGGVAVSAAPAHSTPFASFSDQGNTASVVVANWPTPPAKNAYAGSPSATVAKEPVSFAFEGFPTLAPDLLSPQNATLSYAVRTTAAASATTVSGLGLLDNQPMNQSFTLSFIRTTPYTPADHPNLHLTNLLTVTVSALPGRSTTAQMYGIAGSGSAHLDSDASYATVNFASDFLNFANTSGHSMALSYTLQTLQYLGVGAKFLTAYDKATGGTASAGTCPAHSLTPTALCDFRGFTATESGNFGSAPPSTNLFTVPEPATMGVFGLGLLGLGMSRRRRPD